MAMENSNYGIITNLSRQFNVSRPFIYDAIDSLKAVFRHPSKVLYTFLGYSTFAGAFSKRL